MTFKDLFSPQAADYARFRPVYPAELYAWLARQAPARRLAVDVGTGNGQAAVALSSHFEKRDRRRAERRASSPTRSPPRASSTGRAPPRRPASTPGPPTC